MQYKIIKMDGRYSRYGYRYLIEFSKSVQRGTGVLDFDRCRRWFNEQFGWSQDVETRSRMQENQRHNRDAYQENDINPVWAYGVKYGDYRIYVDDDKTLSWFVLCHPASP
jgi:hypothetical protein